MNLSIPADTSARAKNIVKQNCQQAHKTTSVKELGHTFRQQHEAPYSRSLHQLRPEHPSVRT